MILEGWEDEGRKVRSLYPYEPTIEKMERERLQLTLEDGSESRADVEGWIGAPEC